MSRIKLLIVLLVCLLCGGLSASAVWLLQYNAPGIPSSQIPAVPDFALLDQFGRHHRLYRYKDATAVVLYSHQSLCPEADLGLDQLVELRDKFWAKGVRFFIINWGFLSEQEDSVEKSNFLNLAVPVLKDDSQVVSRTLGFLGGGQAVLVDPKLWQVRYRGPVKGGGTTSPQSSGAPRYLGNAIKTIIANEPIAVPIVTETTCLTKFAETFYQKSVSYNDRIVPILKEKCISCHRQGGVAPWAMDSHDTLRLWASRVREVILTRTMPPWHADPAIGEFAQDRSLTPAEQQDLIHWIDTGAANDEDNDALVGSPAAIAGEWPLGEPDRVIDLPRQKLPARAIIPYRWVKLPVPVKSDTWVRAVHLKPSNPSVMHHGFVFVKYPERLKASEPSWLEGRNGFFVAFVPGLNVLPLPEGSGQLLPAGGTLIFQLHYVANGAETEDKPRLALYFHDDPPQTEYKIVSAANMGIQIPPHAAEHIEKAEAIIEEDGQLQGFYPHMHYRGKWFQYGAIYPDGKTEKLLSVPKYDIHWQTFYRLKNPKRLPRGTRIVVNGAFDNSAGNPVNPDPSQAVKWGVKSSDEMLVGYFMYTRERNPSIH